MIEAYPLATGLLVGAGTACCLAAAIWPRRKKQSVTSKTWERKIFREIPDPFVAGANPPRTDRELALTRALRMALASLEAVDTHESITNHIRRALTLYEGHTDPLSDAGVTALASQFNASITGRAITILADDLSALLNAAFVLPTPAHFNGLSPAEAERLTLLAEESSEVIKAACKVLRHGYASTNPDAPEDGTNRDQLAQEIGDANAAAIRLQRAGDVEDEVVGKRAAKKLYDVYPFLHHQGGA